MASPKILRHRPHRERIGHIRNAHPSYGYTLGQWDVSKLPDGFYDLRFMTSDGFHYYEYVVVGLKVARSRPGGGGGERNLGTPGRNLLAETDMEIPLFGYDASIARSYDSYDTLTPGDFGYGWRMRKFGVGVEIVEMDHVRGEYEEVYVTLPDGREFFFANAPDQGNATTLPPDTWEGDGYYAIHPYGIKMKRDGASDYDNRVLLDPFTRLYSDDGTTCSCQARVGPLLRGDFLARMGHWYGFGLVEAERPVCGETITVHVF